MNGTHRSQGIWIADGGEAGSILDPPTRLARVAPWLAQAMGLAWPTSNHDDDGSDASFVAYSDDEEAMVAERLRALGYLE